MAAVADWHNKPLPPLPNEPAGPEQSPTPAGQHARYPSSLECADPLDEPTADGAAADSSPPIVVKGDDARRPSVADSVAEADALPTVTVSSPGGASLVADSTAWPLTVPRASQLLAAPDPLRLVRLGPPRRLTYHSSRDLERSAKVDTPRRGRRAPFRTLTTTLVLCIGLRGHLSVSD